MTDAPQVPDPGYRLSLSADGDTLYVQVSGDIDAQAIRIAYWQEIIATARTRNFRKLLVTDRKKGQPASPAELAELARILSVDREHFDRVAVIEPTLKFLPAVEHAEIQGRALGINVRIFDNTKNAERWVRYGSPDEVA